MPKKPSSIDTRAASFARSVQSTSASLQNQRSSLADPLHGAHIYAPLIRTPRTKTKRTTQGPSTLATLGSIAADATFGALTGFTSATQSAGHTLSQLLLGQRIS